MTDEAKLIGHVLDILETAAAEHGHVFVYRQDIANAFIERGLVADHVQALELAQAAGHVVLVRTRVYAKHLYDAERAVEQSIGALLTKEPEPKENPNDSDPRSGVQ